MQGSRVSSPGAEGTLSTHTPQTTVPQLEAGKRAEFSLSCLSPSHPHRALALFPWPFWGMFSFLKGMDSVCTPLVVCVTVCTRVSV